jgi:hypothetical protein
MLWYCSGYVQQMDTHLETATGTLVLLHEIMDTDFVLQCVKRSCFLPRCVSPRRCHLLRKKHSG